jgi:ubiquinone biosynthesis accessory factor UbiJ
VIEAPALGILNHLLGQAAWARAKLEPFAGRQACFIMPPWQLAFVVTGEGLFQTAARHEAEPDVTVTLPGNSPLLAFQGIDRLMATAHVTGNAEFATELSFVLRNLRWDAEEDLSRFVGDIAAHRMVRTAASFVAWQKRSVESLAQNIAEYLSEEAHLLTPARELAELRSNREELDRRIAALEARVKRLL